MLSREDLAAEWRNNRGERLRLGSNFARHIAGGYWTLVNGSERLAGHTIKNIEESGLTGLRYDIDRFAVVLDGYKLRSRDGVVDPEIVMTFLEVPLVLTGASIDRE